MKIKTDVDMGDTLTLINAKTLMVGVRRGVLAGAVHLTGKMRVYPHQPPSVDYVRTHDLQRGWSYEASRGGLTQKIGNNVDYMDDVQGSQNGANSAYFRRVWGGHSVKAVVNRESRRVVEIIGNEVSKSFR